jgi:hypothetical protein
MTVYNSLGRQPLIVIDTAHGDLAFDGFVHCGTREKFCSSNPVAVVIAYENILLAIDIAAIAVPSRFFNLSAGLVVCMCLAMMCVFGSANLFQQLAVSDCHRGLGSSGLSKNKRLYF